MHRVVNKLGRERYSIPYFFEPNFDTEVGTACTASEPAGPHRYSASFSLCTLRVLSPSPCLGCMTRGEKRLGRLRLLLRA